MSRNNLYSLARVGNLLILRAAVTGTEGRTVVLRLLVDTGASHTLVPVEAVERVGCDTHHPQRMLRIMAASGVIIAPVVTLARFHFVGKIIEGFPVVAHTLPSGTYVDGLLGMDFLSQIGAVLDLGAGTLETGK